MSSSATGREPWREAGERAAEPAPDPENLNDPATGEAGTRNIAGEEGISAFNTGARDAADQAETSRIGADEAAQRAREAADEATAANTTADATSTTTATPAAAAPAMPAAGVVTPADATTTDNDSAPIRAMTLGMAVTSAPGRYLFALARILLGWVFFWAFLDKLFGLGKSTPSEASWINGGSPTSGYLNNVEGPFKGFFNSMAGQTWADWLFMIGLAGIGLALILGIGMWLAAITGTILMVFMWMASLPLTTNPFLDEHLIYAVMMLGLAFVRGGDTLGLGKPWARTGLVRAVPFLRLTANPPPPPEGPVHNGSAPLPGVDHAT
ncbi:DoxX family protein [Phytomonospora sp. NPDC050363]|uniref:DoxX family protein n=1 Tax=Phytomonospora sp. NPDC050363 TaxID=3155642 RepID=UPI0033C0AA7E